MEVRSRHHWAWVGNYGEERNIDTKQSKRKEKKMPHLLKGTARQPYLMKEIYGKEKRN